ncbi:MAG: GYDIA family GHMP kinase [Bacteroidales bacterium]
MISKKYFSKGKLLVSGEYLVLHGALALAVPTRFGQSMSIGNTAHKGVIDWHTYVQGKSWFQSRFSTPDFFILKSNNSKSAGYIQRILLAAKKHNPSFLIDMSGYQINSELNFNIDWGLGSSSSLISNIAYWADVDPYDLHSEVSRGSGYDIACSRASGSVLYKKFDNRRMIEEVDFNPPFSDKIYFIYLGRKMDTEPVVNKFYDQNNDFYYEIQKIDEITRQMVHCTDYKVFGELMQEHEAILSAILNEPTLKNGVFNDFDGQIKSLGAWGGDFAMALWTKSRQELIEYLSYKRLNTFFGFKEMIYDSSENR